MRTVHTELHGAGVVSNEPEGVGFASSRNFNLGVEPSKGDSAEKSGHVAVGGFQVWRARDKFGGDRTRGSGDTRVHNTDRHTALLRERDQLTIPFSARAD